MSALNKKSFLTYLKEGGIYVVLLVLLAIIIFQDPTFLSLLNLSNILTQSSVRIIIALGVAGLIVTQGTDLSAGRQVGLAAVVAATLLQSMDNANKVFPEMATMPIALVILIVCAIGAVIGLINGLIIAYLNVTPFITTLGTMIIVYGINSLYYDFVGASPISGFDSGFSTFAQGFVALGSFRLSYITFYALIAVAFVWVLWNKTRFGKNIFAIGGNPEAAKVSGVNVGLNLLMIYALSGVFYAFGGMLEAGRIGSATNNLGFMYDPFLAAMIGGVLVGGALGAINGCLVNWTGLHPFIITLGTNAIFRGITLVISDANSVYGFSFDFVNFFAASVIGIPVPVIFSLIVALILWFLTTRMRLGRNIYALGGNKNSAFYSGIDVKFHILVVFIISGVCAGLAGVVSTARLGAAEPLAGMGFETYAIASAIIGGTSFFGGKGRIFSVVIGGLIIGTINNGLNILQVQTYYQLVVMGGLIIAAVALDRLISK